MLGLILSANLAKVAHQLLDRHPRQRGTSEPQDTDAHAPVHEADQRFSKKATMHAHAVAIHFTWYNFVKIHGSLRMTPAMAVGVTDRLWEVKDVIRLLPAAD